MEIRNDLTNLKVHSNFSKKTGKKNYEFRFKKTMDSEEKENQPWAIYMRSDWFWKNENSNVQNLCESFFLYLGINLCRFIE